MLFKTLLVFSLLLSSYTTKEFTGPSWCKLYLIPIATGNGGTVLFKTFSQINTSGGSISPPIKIGWLIISAQGKWEQLEHASLDSEIGGGMMSHADSVFLKEFEAPFNWQKPPESVRALISRYKLYHAVKSDEGCKSISWTKYGIYKNGRRLQKESRINTLLDVSNIPGEGTPLHASFYCNGIALFRSNYQMLEDESGELAGALFKPEGVEMFYTIDGIVIVKGQ
jgi:hypothetical protein